MTLGGTYYDQQYQFSDGYFVITGGSGLYDAGIGGVISITLKPGLNIQGSEAFDLFSFSSSDGAFASMELNSLPCYEVNGKYYAVTTNIAHNSDTSTYQVIYNTTPTCISSPTSSASGESVFF